MTADSNIGDVLKQPDKHKLARRDWNMAFYLRSWTARWYVLGVSYLDDLLVL